ncbi:hypothetical protein [Frankia sp. AgW1.1]|uniref:hypothetical protein n=1 Tax=Frankia sp. AgW1.1 TaxID=1836971 RepID=UPI0027DD270B|nr:hypothetical protein [Frankia sp. AgW1.1]
MPRARGGSNALSNLTPCCTPCGQSKGDLTIADWVAVRAAEMVVESAEWSVRRRWWLPCRLGRRRDAGKVRTRRPSHRLRPAVLPVEGELQRPDPRRGHHREQRVAQVGAHPARDQRAQRLRPPPRRLRSRRRARRRGGGRRGGGSPPGAVLAAGRGGRDEGTRRQDAGAALERGEPHRRGARRPVRGGPPAWFARRGRRVVVEADEHGQQGAGRVGVRETDVLLDERLHDVGPSAGEPGRRADHRHRRRLQQPGHPG